MTLAGGTRLGPYDVVAQIGAGGMGQVYRAHDARLGRDVAIKILPESFSADADRVARFQREARVLAQLNHPNIACVYGLEQAGVSQALVMELVEGEDLSTRLARGPMTIDEALPAARQIVDALEAAHDQGIVHRDLKPANIKMTPAGTVKVLDFGLAKPTAAAGGAPGSTYAPTLTSPVTAAAGVLIGTAAYMSPEQARGRAVDKRADIWAFGCVLFEMLTGRRAFDDEDVSLTLSRVLQREPDWALLPATTPVRVCQLLRRCLEKDPRRRLRDIGDARFDLDAADAPADTAPAVVPPRRIPAWRTAALALLSLIAGSALTWALIAGRTPPRPAPPLVQSHVLTPHGIFSRNPAGAPLLALSPDGRVIAYGGDGPRLYRRDLDKLTEQAVAGAEGITVNTPAFSPDGKWLAYAQSTATSYAVMKVSLAGGAPIKVVDVEMRGIGWAGNEAIVYGTVQPGGLFRAPTNGGAPAEITKLEAGEQGHWRPEVLPDGDTCLFTIWSGSLDTAQIAVVSLKTGERKTLTAGTYPRWLSPGYIVFARANTLWAAPFDPARRELTAAPVPVLEGVALSANNGVATFALSRDGTLVYQPGVTTGTGPGSVLESRFVWLDRQARQQATALPVRAYQSYSLSPDETRVAVVMPNADGSGSTNLWVGELSGGTLTRITFDQEGANTPLWTRDGERIVYRHADGLFSRRADGTGTAERLLTGGVFDAGGWTADGDLVYQSRKGISGPSDIAILHMTGDRRSEVLLGTPASEAQPAVSPDGRWLAYELNDTGRSEIHVRTLPDVNRGRWQVSYQGGRAAQWSADGRSLIFATPSSQMALALSRASVEAAPTFRVVAAEPMFPSVENVWSASFRPFALSRDGQRILVRALSAPVTTPAASSASAVTEGLVMVQHWGDEVARRVRSAPDR